jgi:glycosyltransferase involved in cell wall biosynthesis
MIYQSPEYVKNPLCSVFIFTYNQENLISQTVESILEQETDFSFEIIIAEDCGTDKTKEICIEFQKMYPDRVKVIAMDENVGMMLNYHENLYAHAKGKYVAQCAGDDYWCDKMKLQKQVEFLENNSNYGLVHTSVRVLDVESGRQREMLKFDLDEGLKEFFFENKTAALTACFRLDIFKQYYDEINPLKQNWHSEDYPMWLYFAGHTKIKVIEDVTAVYRVYADSMSRPKDLDKFLFRIKTRLKFRKFYLNYYKMDKPFCDDIIYLTYMEAQYWAGKAGDKEYCNEIKQFYKIHGYVTLSLFMLTYEYLPFSFPIVSIVERFLIKFNLIKIKKFPNKSYMYKKIN